MVKKPEDDMFSKTTMQSNFSSILYLLSEQQSMIGKLFQALLDSGVIDSRQLSDITDTSDGEDDLLRTYTQLYNRFANYYLRTKQLLEQENLENEAVDKIFKEEEKEER